MSIDSFYDSLKIGVIMHFSATSGIVFQYVLFYSFSLNATKANSSIFRRKQYVFIISIF